MAMDDNDVDWAVTVSAGSKCGVPEENSKHISASNPRLLQVCTFNFVPSHFRLIGSPSLWENILFPTVRTVFPSKIWLFATTALSLQFDLPLRCDRGRGRKKREKKNKIGSGVVSVLPMTYNIDLATVRVNSAISLLKRSIARRI